MPYLPAPLPPSTQAVKSADSGPIKRPRLSWTSKRAWLVAIVAALLIVTLVVLYFAGF